MGELDVGATYESFTQGEKRKSTLIAAIMLIIGLFSPVLISVFNYAMIPEVLIQGMFWTYSQSSYGWYGNGFSNNTSIINMGFYISTS